jgi:hypothetical protein
MKYKESTVSHIDLDTQGDAVKQFFLSLPEDPEGAMVELNGHAVARLLPPVPCNGHAVDEEWTDAKNQRRCELIDRRYDSALTPTEEAELAALQSEMHRYVDRVAPLPIEAARQLHQQLLEKAAKTRSGTDA